jgi:drug/metabolite transporter (DMT)-like permease
LFLALSVVWGIPYLFLKIAVGSLAPPVVVFGRCALAGVLLLPLAAARGALRPLLARWRWVVAFAVAEIAGPFAMLGYAELRLSSSLTALLIAAVPLVGAVLTRTLRLGDPIDGRRLVGLLVGIAGVVALVGIDVHGGDLVSVAAAGLAVLGYAIGPLLASTVLAELPAVGLAAVALALNALWYAPLAWVTRPSGSVPGGAWLSVGVLGVVCSAVAFLVFFALVAEVGPARTTVITYVNPAVAVVLGVAVLGEPVTLGIVAGFPLVLLGSWLATRRPVIREPTPP